jgi:hypothetical protein
VTDEKRKKVIAILEAFLMDISAACLALDEQLRLLVSISKKSLA